MVQVATTEITIKGQTYCVPTDRLCSAIAAWDQFRHEHRERLSTRFVKAKVREICNAITPFDVHDTWGPERLARCVLSRLGQRGGKKRGATPSSTTGSKPPSLAVDRQLSLPFGD